jgi:hypothetical protein
VNPVWCSTAARTVNADASTALSVLSADLLQRQELRRFERRCNDASLSRRAGGAEVGSISRSAAKVRACIAGETSSIVRTLHIGSGLVHRYHGLSTMQRDA